MKYTTQGNCPYCDSELGIHYGWSGSQEMFADYRKKHNEGHPENEPNKKEWPCKCGNGLATCNNPECKPKQEPTSDKLGIRETLKEEISEAVPNLMKIAEPTSGIFNDNCKHPKGIKARFNGRNFCEDCFKEPTSEDWEKEHREWLYDNVVFGDAQIEQEIQFITNLLKSEREKAFNDGRDEGQGWNNPCKQCGYNNH